MTVGDKYIIEIEEKLVGFESNPLARIKGFNALVFDENGLNKLEKYVEKPCKAVLEKAERIGYVKGYEYAAKLHHEKIVNDEIEINSLKNDRDMWKAKYEENCTEWLGKCPKCKKTYRGEKVAYCCCCGSPLKHRRVEKEGKE